MLQLLNQVHFHFNLCPKVLLRIYVQIRYLRLYSDDLAGMVVAIVHVDNLVHITLSSSSKRSKLRISDDFVFCRLERGLEPSVVSVDCRRRHVGGRQRLGLQGLQAQSDESLHGPFERPVRIWLASERNPLLGECRFILTPRSTWYESKHSIMHLKNPLAVALIVGVVGKYHDALPSVLPYLGKPGLLFYYLPFLVSDVDDIVKFRILLFG